MKRLITGSIVSIIAVLGCASAFAGDAEVKVYVNGRLTKLSPPAIMRDGKTYVGLRSAAKALGGSTKWIEESKTAMVTVSNKRTKVPQSQGITINSVLYLPLRTTGEAVGCSVVWDKNRRAIKITSEAAPPNCYG